MVMDAKRVLSTDWDKVVTEQGFPAVLDVLATIQHPVIVERGTMFKGGEELQVCVYLPAIRNF